MTAPRSTDGASADVNAVTWTAADGTTVTIRPIRPSDLALEQAFVDGLSQRTAYQRLLSARRVSPEEVRRFTDIDPEREFALIATIGARDAQREAADAERQVGVARYVNQASDSAEFAIVLSDDWQRRGLGRRLLGNLIDTAKKRGVRRLFGATLSENTAMIRLARSLGFTTAVEPDDATVTNLTLELPPRR